VPRKESATTPVLKHVALSWRPPDRADWQITSLTVTSFNINAGALTLFYRGQLIRILAPGCWADVTVVGEEPVES
jgi:hypothetical protein